MGPSRMAYVGRRFWDLVRDGMPPGEAGLAAGVSITAGRRWFAEAGGVRPRFREPAAMGQRPRMTYEEREEIQDGVARHESIREIARRLGRHPSTVMHEINRNGWCRGRYRARYRFGAGWRGG
jgi:transposase, IS30 family